jgi:hypothetical protein
MPGATRPTRSWLLTPGTCPNVRRRHALCREHGPEQARVQEPALAHPEFREELTAAAKAMYLI